MSTNRNRFHRLSRKAKKIKKTLIKRLKHVRRDLVFNAATWGLLGLLLLRLIFALSSQASVWAQGAEMLRDLIGDRAVARLEDVAFTAQDQVNTWKYNAGFLEPQQPWDQASDPVQPASTPVVPPTPTPQSVAQAGPGTASRPPEPDSPPDIWAPQSLKPLGILEREGSWSSYIFAEDGTPLAYRAFLQPDPDRPYAVVAVVVFELSRTRLHFVLGSIEPKDPNAPPHSGAMPAGDQQPGKLLAVFNGGFKSVHGKFSAMADGITVFPPRDGLGTLAIYRDGTIDIGEWNSQITMSPEVLAYRQNGPLILRHGEINPAVSNLDPRDWGYTVDTVSPTWRSGVGISPDRNELFYFCGPSLSVDSLAKAMKATGVEAAIQLDINAYWVFFAAAEPQGDRLSLEVLFPHMNEDKDRYLEPYYRDYFYVTTAP